MMAQNDLGGPPRRSKDGTRKRAAKPKVRTGCITCKIRRVKCDENKPECQRCLKFGIKCDGFLVLPPPRGSNQQRDVSDRPLVPYGQREIPILLPEPTSSRFQTPEEHRFFQLYATKTATHLAGFYDPILWNQIVLQVSEAEKSIRHAVISIGALDMTMVSGPNTVGKIGVPPAVEAHHVFALKQYSKAINSLRQSVFSRNYDLRTALVASLLIVCFETYHGNYESANRQTRTAVRLIEDRSTSTSLPTFNPENGITNQSQEVEEELLRAFERLDIQSISHTDPFTLSEHLIFKDSNAEILSSIPSTFTSVAQARNYFNFMTRAALHFGCAFWVAHSSPLSQTTSTSTSFDLARPSKPSFSYFDAAQPQILPDFLAERDERLKLAEAYMSSFLPLFNHHRKNPGSKAYLAVSAQRIHWLIIDVSLKAMGSPHETIYDAALDSFKEMVGLAEELLFPVQERRERRDSGDGERIFTFDLQTVMPLDLAAKKCRDPVVRRKAIELLRCRPRREGFWDSCLAVEVCEWVLGVEEEGMVGGFVEDGQRARGVGVKLDDEGGRARVWCTLGTGERREGVVCW